MNEKNVVSSNTIDERDIYVDEKYSKTNDSAVGDVGKIMIHIVGEINKPGVYELSENSRLKDAIEIAGGLTEVADLSKINLVHFISDGQKINIPRIGDDSFFESDVIVSEKDDNFSKKININNASQTELECITGIGPSLAARIIEYRKENGKFGSVEDIKNVSGIGESKYRNIVNEITV